MPGNGGCNLISLYQLGGSLFGFFSEETGGKWMGQTSRAFSDHRGISATWRWTYALDRRLQFPAHTVNTMPSEIFLVCIRGFRLKLFPLPSPRVGKAIFNTIL